MVLDRLLTPWLGDTGQAPLYWQIAQADQLHTDEMQEQYGEIGIPTLVCRGQQDTWIPATKGRDSPRASRLNAKSVDTCGR